MFIKVNGPMRGRPYLYTPKLALEICQWIADGKTLLAYCKREDVKVVRSTIMEWLLKEPDFAEKYQFAQSLRADHYCDECIEIADDCGSTIPQINKAKLRVDTRKWTCTIMAPKKYGNRTITELTGKDGGPIDHRDVTSLSDLELEAIAAGKTA